MRMRTMPRDFYIPKDAIKLDPASYGNVEGVEFYTLQKGSYIQGLCFLGKQSKPQWNYLYKTNEQFMNAVNREIEGVKMSQDYKAKRRAEKQAFVPDVKVGDIFYTSWGYDQTNVEFYQVTKVIAAKTVEIQRIAGNYEETGWASGYTTAEKDAFLDKEQYMAEPMIRRVLEGNTLKITESATAWKDTPGRKHYTSSYA